MSSMFSYLIIVFNLYDYILKILYIKKYFKAIFGIDQKGSVPLMAARAIDIPSAPAENIFWADSTFLIRIVANYKQRSFLMD
jgi:hypothetical protein